MAGAQKFADQPAWVRYAAVGFGGLFVLKMLDGNATELLSLPRRVGVVETRADRAEDSLKGIGVQLERLIAVQKELDADRIKREADAAAAQRRQLDEAAADAKRRDEERQRFWQEQRAQDRAALRDAVRDAVAEQAAKGKR